MLPENKAETRISERTQIDIIINRAALGNAPYVYALIRSVEGEPHYPAYVPREDIIINEQPLSSGELSAKLSVGIVEDQKHYYLVETENEKGDKVTLRVNKIESKIEPVKHKAIFT